MIHFTNINGERLPEDVNKIANERYDGEFKPDDKNELVVTAGFYWWKTIEGKSVWGESIWYQVEKGNYEPLREFHRNNTEKIMNPAQQKAAELIEKFENKTNSLVKDELAKQCAIIAVDEMTELANKMDGGFSFEKEIDFLQEVKNELSV